MKSIYFLLIALCLAIYCIVDAFTIGNDGQVPSIQDENSSLHKEEAIPHSYPPRSFILQKYKYKLRKSLNKKES